MDPLFVHGLLIILKAMPVSPLFDKITDIPASNNKRPYSLDFYNKEYFVRACLREYPTYSENEAENLYYRMRQYDVHRTYGDMGIFSLINFFANQALLMEGKNIRCRHEEILNWREAIHGIGQSIFICAYKAWQDTRNFTKQTSFDFSPYIKTDNMRLRNMLSQGMAENHFHLKGSSPVFLLSWVCLMNHVTNRKKEFELMQRSFFRLEQEDKNTSLSDLIIKAAAIRLYLTRLMTDGKFESEEGSESGQSESCRLRRLIYNPKLLIDEANNLQNIINTQRFFFQGSFDYIIDTSRMKSAYGPISGENYFLYKVFYAIYSKDPRLLNHVDLFYAYLLIFIRLRGELIQTNNNVGFHNFKLYEQRKDIFIENYKNFKDASIIMAHCSVLDNPAILQLEARLTPKKSVKEIEQMMNNTLRLTNFCSSIRCSSCSYFEEATRKCNAKKRYCKTNIAKVAYVFHLVKQSDKFRRDDMIESHKHRHYDYIHGTVEPMINAIIEWRKTGNETAGYVYAIDACNAEIGCRPEVFAPGFRKIRVADIREYNSRLIKTDIPIMHITYHVGEDFLDIVDGLRAIDEAINFLELRRGDRLGHAIALGVCPGEWYHFKDLKVLLSKQDLLDNAVWMYMALHKYGLHEHKLAHELFEIFRANYNYLYQGILPLNNEIDMDTYYDSWKLRGDNPKFYRDIANEDLFFKAIKSARPGELQNGYFYSQIRNENFQARLLLHNYHYNPQVKKRGMEVTSYIISTQYIQAVVGLQEAMQKDCARMGLAIETNPSSNYLIGTFKKYEKHPILSFNDQGLNTNEQRPELFVSINTDDQGVFDTDLENEFSLMANALENCTDAAGNFLYKPADVYRWLDNIRRMGLEQSFKQTIRADTRGYKNANKVEKAD